MLRNFNKSNRKGENVNKKFPIINELKILKSEQHQIINKYMLINFLIYNIYLRRKKENNKS